jgi:hypothetical protein
MSAKACIVANVDFVTTHWWRSAIQVENNGRNVPIPKVLTNHGLTQPIRVEQELGNVLGLFARDEASLDKELYRI